MKMFVFSVASFCPISDFNPILLIYYVFVLYPYSAYFYVYTIQCYTMRDQRN